MTIHKQTKLWETRDGRKIRICDMADQHLVHAINMLRRNAAVDLAVTTTRLLTLPPPSGDMAQDVFDDEVRRAAEQDWRDHVHELYDPMVLDFERRGLDPDLLQEPPSADAITIKFLKMVKGAK